MARATGRLKKSPRGDLDQLGDAFIMHLRERKDRFFSLLLGKHRFRSIARGIRLLFVTSPNTSPIEHKAFYRTFPGGFVSCEALWLVAWAINEHLPLIRIDEPAQ